MLLQPRRCGFRGFADQNANVLATITAPSGGGKVIVERGRFEVYDVTSVTLDETNLSAGSCRSPCTDPLSSTE